MSHQTEREYQGENENLQGLKKIDCTMNEIERQDRIDQYVRGEMSLAEKEDFLKEMAADSSLAEDVQLIEEISKKLGALEEKKHLMEQWENEMQEGQTAPSGADSGRSVMRTLYAVVGLAACLIVGFFFFNNNVEDEGAVRGSASVEQIAKMIDEGKYEEAIGAIDEMLADTIIDKSLPEEEQQYLKAEQELNRKKLDALRKRAMEQSKK